MRKVNFLILFALFAAQILCVSAFESFSLLKQEASLMKGAEKAAFGKETGDGKCFVFGKYTVKTVASEDLGEEIEIYRNSAAVGDDSVCDNLKTPYFTIKNADANYFFGLSGEYVFVDNGTGSDGRGLEVFNLKTKKSIYTTEYYIQAEIEQNRFLVYDKYSETKGALKSCRQAAQWKKDGFSIGWVRSSKLDLQTLKETPTGTIRCRAFQ